MARIVDEFPFYLRTQAFIHEQKLTIPAFAFSAEGGPHLPIPEGWSE